MKESVVGPGDLSALFQLNDLTILWFHEDRQSEEEVLFFCLF